LKGNKTEPQFVVLGRARDNPRVFGILWRLTSCQAEYFPPVITERPGTHPTRSLHPFLHGYQGVDHATENKVLFGSYCAVPHGWGGPAIYCSWAMAWAASADFKILAYQNLPGSSLDSFATATRRRFASFEAASSHLNTCSAVKIPQLAPPHLQEYMDMQFCEFGINPSRYSSWRGLDPPELTFYNRMMVDIQRDEPDPATDAPRYQAPDTSSASDVLSLDMESQADNLANRRRHGFRQRTVRHISDKAMYKLPNDKDSFLQWEQLTEVELLQDPWCLDGLTIMRHLHNRSQPPGFGRLL
jgi:hypothetical protein